MVLQLKSCTLLREVQKIFHEIIIFHRFIGFFSLGSEDWANGVAQIPYAFCLELRPGQTGTDSNFGFTLPEVIFLLIF